jgi:two-component system response regulator
LNNNQELKTVSVIVVEDSPDDAHMTLRALSRLGRPPVVTLVRDGEEALRLLVGPTAARPDMIFLDLKLPKVHGLDVLRELRQDPRTSGVPVVILTSSDLPSDIARASELGASEYICKPMDPEQYVHMVCGAVEKHLWSTIAAC